MIKYRTFINNINYNSFLEFLILNINHNLKLYFIKIQKTWKKSE